MEEVLVKFKKATDVLDDMDLDYLVMGGIAVWAYGRRRKTRDIDLLVRRDDARKVLEALGQAGFSTERTDERWLYKAKQDDVDIDIIFETKGEIGLSEEILSRQRSVDIDDLDFKVIDPENLVRIKILVKKEIRPADWYDALSIIESLASRFDWTYFAEISHPYAMKVLSFLFFAQGEHEEKTGQQLVPPEIIDHLIRVYRNGNS